MIPPGPPTPPAFSECTTTTQAPHPGAAPQQSLSRVYRSSDGKMRTDSGNTTVVTNPAAGHTLLIDHAKKQFQVLPMQPPQPPGKPAMPSGKPPTMPPLPMNMPPISVQDLGRAFIEGHEVEGKRYTFAAPEKPKPPQPPSVPHSPAIPGAPPLPPPPQGLKPPEPPKPTIADVWTSTTLHLPVLTKMTGPFGERTTYCKHAPTGEPDPSVFQVPAGYKQVIGADPPKPPTPKLPSLPSSLSAK